MCNTPEKCIAFSNVWLPFMWLVLARSASPRLQSVMFHQCVQQATWPFLFIFCCALIPLEHLFRFVLWMNMNAHRSELSSAQTMVLLERQVILSLGLVSLHSQVVCKESESSLPFCKINNRNHCIMLKPRCLNVDLLPAKLTVVVVIWTLGEGREVLHAVSHRVADAVSKPPHE